MKLFGLYFADDDRIQFVLCNINQITIQSVYQSCNLVHDIGECNVFYKKVCNPPSYYDSGRFFNYVLKKGVSLKDIKDGYEVDFSGDDYESNMSKIGHLAYKNMRLVSDSFKNKSLSTYQGALDLLDLLELEMDADRLYAIINKYPGNIQEIFSKYRDIITTWEFERIVLSRLLKNRYTFETVEPYLIRHSSNFSILLCVHQPPTADNNWYKEYYDQIYKYYTTFTYKYDNYSLRCRLDRDLFQFICGQPLIHDCSVFYDTIHGFFNNADEYQKDRLAYFLVDELNAIDVENTLGYKLFLDNIEDVCKIVLDNGNITELIPHINRLGRLAGPDYFVDFLSKYKHKGLTLNFKRLANYENTMDFHLLEKMIKL